MAEEQVLGSQNFKNDYSSNVTIKGEIQKKVAKNWLNLQILVKNVKKCNFSLNLQELRKFQ